jgi:hypothetical protein
MTASPTALDLDHLQIFCGPCNEYVYDTDVDLLAERERSSALNARRQLLLGMPVPAKLLPTWCFFSVDALSYVLSYALSNALSSALSNTLCRSFNLCSYPPALALALAHTLLLLLRRRRRRRRRLLAD